jgi:5-(carboxyamino)imidazole ribonucleotide synthase
MIGILGGGQLGRMLALAGLPLGERFCFLDPNPEAPVRDLGELIVGPYDDPPALQRIAERAGVVTYEFENVPSSALDHLEGRVSAWPPKDALRIAQDRLEEKQLFERVGLEVPTYRAIDDVDGLRRAVEELGPPLVVKTRREGYDGKGQVIVRSGDEAEVAADLLDRPCIAERLVSFDRELSVIAVRGIDGATQIYPLVQNHHVEGILRLTLASAPDLAPGLQERADSVITTLMNELGYVGVLALELFEVDGELLGNEMAPRVHNSGHWTIEGAHTSQFENHIRAVTGRPLGSAEARGDWAMVNLIGDLPDLRGVLALPDVHLHLYDKTARPGRKLGHVTLPQDGLPALSAVAGIELPPH